MTFMLRTAVPPMSVAGAVRVAAAGIDRTLPILTMRTQEDHTAVLLSRERQPAWLASAFGLLAIVLAGVGLHGVLAFTVIRRTPEIGIRLAPGSSGARRGRSCRPHRPALRH